MHIFTGGIATETNTFSPLPAGLRDFSITRARDRADGRGKFGVSEPLGVFEEMAGARGWDLTFGFKADAQPAGPATRAVYEGLRNELLDSLEAALPVDMVLLFLHGAMVAHGYDDCETDILARVRRIAGASAKVGVLLDLHCDVTREMINLADVIVLYKEYPHTDIADRARDVFTLTAQTAVGETNPTMGLFDCRMIGIYSTTVDPLRSFVDDMLAQEAKDNVLSLSLVHGFPWADVPTVGTRMLAITDGDRKEAEALAEEWGRLFFSLRREVHFHSLPLDEALDRALASEGRPVVLADQSDNAGGGAPSDSTFVLAELLRRGVTEAALGMVWDPAVVEIAMAAEIGATLDVRLGGKIGPVSGDPLDLRVEVAAIQADMKQEWPQGENDPIEVKVGDAVRLHCQGIDIIVNSKRVQVFSPQVFSKLGVDSTRMRLLVVKSTHHFFAAFSPIAAEVIHMSAPGAVAPRILDIPYTRVDRNKYPWVDDPFAS
jgi:microcystin degradation protein MlrC